MATLVLSAAGSALGGAVGGSLAGIGASALGRAAGSVVGGLIDQQVFGRGAAAVETGRVESFRVQSAVEGAAIPDIYGRMRVGGQLIWSSDFLESVDESRQGGKGGQKVKQFSYTVSFAIGLCEGKITRIGRVWADGNEINLGDYSHTVHKGGGQQQPDILIEAIEGAAPAFRGLAYIVFEDLPLGPFGNRIPQINVEVFREPEPAIASSDEHAPPLADSVRGVALSPGSGEFSLDTEPVLQRLSPGVATYENVNTVAESPDLLPALDQLESEAPNCGAVSLIVSWFGDDLRCGQCEIRPCVETKDKVTEPYSWAVSGVDRAAAATVGADADGRPVFGGTPSDQSVIRAIQELKARGLKVMFYPFILMDVPATNTNTDPWTGAAPQPAYPWRGRITLDRAPGVAGSADKTAAASAEVAAFFGQAAPQDFTQGAESVDYSGPQEWSFRRFILHYAHLCEVAGGVDSFCIGSEMRSLTQIRSGADVYPAVAALQQVATDVRGVLGSATKIGYAADWSEYFGHQPNDGTGDVFFHLDPLWADPAIDFVGIDNYLPLSDWRYDAGHLDQANGARSVYSLPYLSGNVEGAEGYDWYYASAADRATQTRTPIMDGAHGEDWVFRPKDLRNWWGNAHHNRPGGVRDGAPTAWTPEEKPIWFTELGCPAVDLGANQPNVFVDPKSSESFLPYFSNGVRDDYMQQRYIQAVLTHWGDAANNPVSATYGAEMVDLDNVYLWTWDARPWPDFPLRLETWTDGDNHRLGHWLTGRLGAAPLQDVVADICAKAGATDFDVSDLYGVVGGLSYASGETAREKLQTLMLTHGFDAIESGGRLVFRHRDGGPVGQIGLDSDLLLTEAGGRAVEYTRLAEGELPRALRLSYVAADDDYQTAAVEAQTAFTASNRVEAASAPLALDGANARGICERWLSEAHVSRDGAQLTIGRATLAYEAGDVVSLGGDRVYRIDRVEELGARELTLTRVEPLTHRTVETPQQTATPRPVAPAAPVAFHLMDLPLLTGADEAAAVKFAAYAAPWTSPAALYLSRSQEDFELQATAASPAIMGVLETPLEAAEGDRFTRDAGCAVRLFGGGLSGVSDQAILNGANRAAIQTAAGGWEVIQFRTAVLQPDGAYLLTGLLRGQAGTDGLGAGDIAPGAAFVCLNGAVADAGFDLALRGVDLTYQIGPSHKPYTHHSYQSVTQAIAAAALRPYRPAHLKAVKAGGDLVVGWVRRTRIGGDCWDGVDVPLAEDREAYHLRILMAGAELRAASPTSPVYVYTAAQQAADGAAGLVEIAVSQISDRYGRGPETKVTVNV